MTWPSTLWICLLLAALGFSGAYVAGLPEAKIVGAATAVDGDSLRLDGRSIRLKGLDAPEYRQTCQGPDGETPCGREARQALARLLARAPVVCSLKGRDRYGRDLAYCRAGDLDINAALVRDGHAVAYGEYAAEEAEARANRRGLWRLSFEKPSVWREKHPRPGRDH
ncbi:MAG: hypothetical protein BGP06_10175 [Rhizobiales bacterium 65-9]|nr:thermonuclease family protein [Hyphomicrobiales bacterium]OJY33252.1 MAG: hypothetical protein BGP06_10175 [Rhizobiales bacterium 65-9]